jgi:hypothetical protein
MLKVGLIVGSTRPNRFADTPVRWLAEGASARRELQLAVLDLRDCRLPFFNEPASPAYTGGVYTHPEAEAWRNRIGEFDAFIATVAEYNHGPTPVLTPSTAPSSSGNESLSPLSATAALARRARSKPCAALSSNCRWRRFGTK